MPAVRPLHGATEDLATIEYRRTSVLYSGPGGASDCCGGQEPQQRQEADTHDRRGRSLALLVADVLPAMRASAVRQRIVTVEEPTHWIALHHS